MAYAENVFLHNVLSFTELLRGAGLAITLDQTMDYTRALELVHIGSREQVYQAGRCLLVSRKEELPIYDRLFHQFWHHRWQDVEDADLLPQKMPIAPRHNMQPRQALSIATLMAQRAKQDDPEVDVADRSGSFSTAEALQNKAFSQMTDEEIESIHQAIQNMRWQISERVTRRRQPRRAGSALDMRRVLRTAAKHGGTPLRLAWQDRKTKPRPLIVLADISGSMERYSRLLLQFTYCMTHSLGHVECFVFATRLTHVTPYLRLRDIDSAVTEAAAHVYDWSSGTRIGESLRAFNRHWGRQMLRRGAVVIVISDGCEQGSADLLRAEMQHLQRHCHRLIWLNPHLSDIYEPRTEGMSAALPYIDEFLPIRNLQNLAALSRRLASLRR